MTKNALTTFLDPDSTISEQYSSIRTNIQFLTRNNIKSLLITSPNSGEGKSITVSNLALSMSKQSEKVLLVDANFRTPMIHSIMKCSNSQGLSDILMGNSCLKDTIKKIGLIDVLTTGPKPYNPAELLDSRNMSKFINEIVEIYDVVLFDSPSVLDYTDAIILANQCNGVILVIKNGKTGVTRIVEAKKALEFAKSELIGAILNEK